MDVFGYCIAPVNYGGKRSILDESCSSVLAGFSSIASGLKELILVNIIGNTEVKKAVGAHSYLLIVERLQH